MTGGPRTAFFIPSFLILNFSFLISLLLILDNYDSFTWNLVHLVEKCGVTRFEVHLNDKITVEAVEHFDQILLSPGPGIPSEAGIMPELLKTYSHRKSILGVCLGLQAIGECFGSPLRNLPDVFHGMASPVHVIKQDPLFQNCPTSFLAGRYHSWVIDENKISPQLEVTATDDNGLVMAARHRHLDVRGVQFHPESILSEYGEQIIANWLRPARPSF